MLDSLLYMLELIFALSNWPHNLDCAQAPSKNELKQMTIALTSHRRLLTEDMIVKILRASKAAMAQHQRLLNQISQQRSFTPLRAFSISWASKKWLTFARTKL